MRVRAQAGSRTAAGSIFWRGLKDQGRGRSAAFTAACVVGDGGGSAGAAVNPVTQHKVAKRTTMPRAAVACQSFCNVLVRMNTCSFDRPENWRQPRPADVSIRRETGDSGRSVQTRRRTAGFRPNLPAPVRGAAVRPSASVAGGRSSSDSRAPAVNPPNRGISPSFAARDLGGGRVSAARDRQRCGRRGWAVRSSGRAR